MSKKNYLIVIISIVTMLFSMGCDKQEDTGNKIKVVTTIGMITDLVQEIGGEKVSVQGLMGPGIDPHLYRASEGDVAKLANANIIFYHGLHLESKMIDIFDKMKRRKKTVAITQNLDKKKLHKPESYEGYYDPHIWFDIPLWSKTVDSVTTALIEYSPENKDYFTTQSKRYKKELETLHKWINKTLEPLNKDKRILVTAHDAFGYFGSAYAFEVLGLQGISTESEAGTKDVQDLAKTISDRQIPAIFVESSIPKRYVQAAVKARGWNVKIGGELFSDAMGNPGTEEGTFIGMVKHNVTTILQGLNN